MNDAEDTTLDGDPGQANGTQDSMKSEFNRLTTFNKWPKECPVKPVDLAKAGFYYANNDDSVRCFSCAHVLNNWEADDDPYTEHKAHFGKECEFMKDPASSGNVPIESGAANGDIDEDSLDLTEEPEEGNHPMTEKREKRKLVNGESGDSAPKSPRVDGSDDHTLTNSSGDNQTDSVCRAPPTRTGMSSQHTWDRSTETDAVGKTPRGIFTNATFDPRPEQRNVLEHSVLYREAREDPIDILIAKTKQLAIGEAGARQEVQERTLSEAMVKSLMKREQVRLATFETWPKRHIIDPRQVAAVGFYYTGKDDCVKCVFCDGTLESWGDDDIPFGEHKHFFGDVCPLVQGKHTDNIPTFCLSVPELQASRYPIYTQATNDRSKLKGLQMKKARYPQYSACMQRGLTFVEWYKTSPVPVDLVEAGFWYAGVEDMVRCYFCGGGLKAWEHTDIPWKEHAKHFPNCAFLTKVKGSAFVQGVQQDWEVEKKKKNLKPKPGEIVDLRRYNRDEEGLSLPMQVDQNQGSDIFFGRTETDTPEGRLEVDSIPTAGRIEADSVRIEADSVRIETDSVRIEADSARSDSTVHNAGRIETDSEIFEADSVRNEIDNAVGHEISHGKTLLNKVGSDVDSVSGSQTETDHIVPNNSISSNLEKEVD